MNRKYILIITLVLAVTVLVVTALVSEAQITFVASHKNSPSPIPAASVETPYMVTPSWVTSINVPDYPTDSSAPYSTPSPTPLFPIITAPNSTAPTGENVLGGGNIADQFFSVQFTDLYNLHLNASFTITNAYFEFSLPANGGYVNHILATAQVASFQTTCYTNSSGEVNYSVSDIIIDRVQLKIETDNGINLNIDSVTFKIITDNFGNYTIYTTISTNLLQLIGDAAQNIP